MACAGNSAEICGGSNAINIYQNGDRSFTSGAATIPQTVGEWTFDGSSGPGSGLELGLRLRRRFLSGPLFCNKVDRLRLFVSFKGVKAILDEYLEDPHCPSDGGLDKRARILLSISSYTVLGKYFKVPVATL